MILLTGIKAVTSCLRLCITGAVLYVLLAVCLPAALIHAAGGGPPMITDDPGTPEPGCWEINISFDTELKADEKEMETPLLDINYGFNEHTQLRLEVPYLFTKEQGEGWHGRFGHVTPGIKYRFLDEEQAGISASIYPEISISTESGVKNEYAFPVEIEKHFGHVTAGSDIRYIYINSEDDFIRHGLLLGCSITDRMDIMGEFVYELNAESFDEAAGVLNFGMKYKMSDMLTFLTSLGTGIFHSGTEHTDFISFAGIQLNI